MRAGVRLEFEDVRLFGHGFGSIGPTLNIDRGVHRDMDPDKVEKQLSR